MNTTNNPIFYFCHKFKERFIFTLIVINIGMAMISRTINFPAPLHETIVFIVQKRLYPNYSEAVRNLVSLAISQNKLLLDANGNCEDVPHSYKPINIVSVKLHSNLLQLLDRAAMRLGLNRSEFIRTAIIRMISEVLHPSD